MNKELTEEELENLEPKNIIMVDKEGMPCIVIQPTLPPPKFIQIEFVGLDAPKKHRNFTELQKQKEQFFLDKVLKDLEEVFKGWF